MTKEIKPKKEHEVSVVKIQNEITRELASPAVMTALVTTTFKGLSEVSVKQAITEGMLRGFKFKDFLERNVYAIPYSNGYSLITSIDYSRKIGMRSGVVGKSAPSFTYSEADGKVESCTVTIEKMVNGTVGKFTETVYFNEYTTGRNQWVTKPRTMLAKVAEMHALRMACPEELSQAYVEEEMEKETETNKISDEDIILYSEKLESSNTLESLAKNWADLPVEVKKILEKRKEEIKKAFAVAPKEPKAPNANEDTKL